MPQRPESRVVLATGTTATSLRQPHEIDAELSEVLYGQRGHELITFFYRRTRNAEAATDLLAETFANAAVHRRNDETLSAHDGEWLRNIAKLELSRYFRRLRVDLTAVTRLAMTVPRLTESEVAMLHEATMSQNNARLGAVSA